MKKTDVQFVTVVPADRLIIVNGTAVHCDFVAPASLHALQWRAGVGGHMEFTDDFNIPLRVDDATAYKEEVAPFVAAWEKETQRQVAEAAAAEAEYNSLPNVQARKRAEIRAGYDAALAASLTMPSAHTSPSAVEIALALEDFKSDDSEGWTFVRDTHTERRDALLGEVEAAGSPEAVQSIVVSYAV